MTDLIHQLNPGDWTGADANDSAGTIQRPNDASLDDTQAPSINYAEIEYRGTEHLGLSDGDIVRAGFVSMMMLDWVQLERIVMNYAWRIDIDTGGAADATPGIQATDAESDGTGLTTDRTMGATVSYSSGLQTLSRYSKMTVDVPSDITLNSIGEEFWYVEAFIEIEATQEDTDVVLDRWRVRSIEFIG